MSEPEYLDAQAVADQLGIKRKSVWEMLSRGYIPEPDLLYLRHPLWLPETIKEWRKNYRKKGRVRVPRRHRIRTANTTAGRPPRIRTAAKTKASKAGASRPSVTQTVSDQIASQVASALRQDGFHCTTGDVVELAGWVDGDMPLEHEREKLRLRIVAKLRGLKRQSY